MTNLKILAQEESIVLNRLIKEADEEYHSQLEVYHGVSAEIMEWKAYLKIRQKYLDAVLENINNNDLLVKIMRDNDEPDSCG